MIVFSAHSRGTDHSLQFRCKREVLLACSDIWLATRAIYVLLTYYYEAYFRAVTTNVAGLLFVLVLAVFLARLRGARNVYLTSTARQSGPVRLLLLSFSSQVSFHRLKVRL